MNASRRTVIFLLIAALSLPAAPIVAAGADKENEEIPATAVARLKIAKGTAWVRPADTGEWQESGSNTPLAERSRVSVPDGSEAEILYRGNQSLTLRGGAEVEIRELGEKHDTFRLKSGSVALSLPKDEFAPVRFRVTGKREVEINAPGRYSLNAEAGATKFLVSEGEGIVSGEGTSPVTVKAGEEASIGEKIQVNRAEVARPTAQAPPAEQMTEEEREAGIPPEAAGELREYGRWVNTPEYGYVWSPYVAGDWTPYYYGHWVWVYPYGWVWVAYEPWGWWPYHYGWWVDYPSFGWVWCPFRSFVSIDFFFFGHSRFFFHRAFFFGANVRFVNDGRFVRWTPTRPGTTVTRATFSRNDTRLSRWNRPLVRDAVMVRGAGGRLSAWQGAGTSMAGASAAGRTAAKVGSGGPKREFPEGGGRVSARVSSPGVTMRNRADGRVVGGPGRGLRPESGERVIAPRGTASPHGFSGPRGAAPRMGAPSPRTFNSPGSSRGAERSFRGRNGGGFHGFQSRAGGLGDGGFRGSGGGDIRGGGGRMR